MSIRPPIAGAAVSSAAVNHSQVAAREVQNAPALRLSSRMRERLACPCCGAGLSPRAFEFVCSNENCPRAYPVVGGVPILINERASIFRLSDYEIRSSASDGRHATWKARAKRILPALGMNVAARGNFRAFRELLLAVNERPSVLIVGGASVGEGMDELLRDPQIECVETDVSLRSRTCLVCDARDLPFADGTFDGVIIQAVLEYVPDPVRCVEEIWRVLRPEGMVYSEMPFMQQGHGGPYDFTRYTHLGHRRLYRQFSEVSSGVCSGPAMALAWAVQHFLLSFVESRWSRDLVKVLGRCSLFWLKYFDYYLAGKKGGLDAASGTFFLGRKSAVTLTDRELLSQYRGAIPANEVL